MISIAFFLIAFLIITKANDSKEAIDKNGNYLDEKGTIIAVPGAKFIVHLNDSSLTGSCSGYNWYKCPSGKGIPSGSSNYPDCCQGKSANYCPGGYLECLTTGCCPTGYTISCNGICCPSNYPICGSGGMCYTGACSCGGCNPDPCTYQGCGNSCSSCCNLYIPAICSGPATCTSSLGTVGETSFTATEAC